MGERSHYAASAIDMALPQSYPLALKVKCPDTIAQGGVGCDCQHKIEKGFDFWGEMAIAGIHQVNLSAAQQP